MAAQCKRVFVTRWQVADTEHANQRFQLVGQRHHHAGHVARQGVTGKTRLVVVFNRVGHVQTQAIVKRVITAHRALQLGELADHVSDQIGLGQQCGLAGLCGQRIAAELLANRLGNRPHALNALALGAQLVVINHLVQPRHARRQRFLAVLVKKELGIGQARAHHALIAANHGTRIVRRDVADDQKLVRQRALGIEQGEVFLVRLHRQNQAFLRHVQKLFFKRADQHIGPLDQRRHFVQQRIVVNRHHAAADFCRRFGQLAGDFGLAVGKAGDDRAVDFQRGGVAVGVGKHHRIDGGFKTVAVREVASAQAQHLDRHHRAAVQRDQTMRRAHKVHAGPAGQFAVGFQLVAHDFRDRQLGNRFFQRFLQAGV